MDYPYQLDQARLRAKFEALAPHYDKVEHIESESSRRLLSHLDPVNIDPRRILDLGSGTGNCARELAKRYRKADVLEVDYALGMLRQSRSKDRMLFPRRRRLCSDVRHLPLRSDCIDLVYANLTLDWCEARHAVLLELNRVLRPGALLALVTLGPQTLHEFRESWARVDSTTHVHPFLDMHDLGDLVSRAGFTGVVVDAEQVTLQYQSTEKLFHDLCRSGFGNQCDARRKSLTGKRRYQAFRDHYESYRTANGLPLTCELIYVHGWCLEDRAVAIPETHFSLPPKRT